MCTYTYIFLNFWGSTLHDNSLAVDLETPMDIMNAAWLFQMLVPNVPNSTAMQCWSSIIIRPPQILMSCYKNCWLQWLDFCSSVRLVWVAVFLTPAAIVDKQAATREHSIWHQAVFLAYLEVKSTSITLHDHSRAVEVRTHLCSHGCCMTVPCAKAMPLQCTGPVGNLPPNLFPNALQQKLLTALAAPVAAV